MRMYVYDASIRILEIHLSLSFSFKPWIYLFLSSSLLCSSLYRPLLSFHRGKTANRPPNTPNTLFLGCLRGAFSAFCRLNSDPRNKLAADHGGICLLDNLFPSPLGSRPPLRPSPSRSVPSFPSFWPSLCLAFVLAAREKGGLASSSFNALPSSFGRLHFPLHPPAVFSPPVLSTSFLFLFFFSYYRSISVNE